MSFIVRNITSGPPVAVELGDMGITIGIPAAEVTDVTTVADVAGSLGGKFFLLNAVTTKYYVWCDVDNGSTDPTVASRTGIEVDIATNDTANTVASNTQVAIDAVADFGASVSTNVVTITNAVTGEVPDATLGSDSPEFIINTTTQGDGTADFTRENPNHVATSTDLINAIGATDLAVLDPLNEIQLSAADSLIVVSVHNDPHFRSGPGQDQNLIVSFVIEDPTTADAGLLQHKFGQAVTIVRISASTDVGTVTIQFDERVEATPNTSGTDVMTAVLIADTNTEATTAFANANIAADAVLNLDIDAVATSPGVVRIHVEYTPQ